MAHLSDEERVLSSDEETNVSVFDIFICFTNQFEDPSLDELWTPTRRIVMFLFQSEGAMSLLSEIRILLISWCIVLKDIQF